jgi:hypothetical protein
MTAAPGNRKGIGLSRVGSCGTGDGFGDTETFGVVADSDDLREHRDLMLRIAFECWPQPSVLPADE